MPPKNKKLLQQGYQILNQSVTWQKRRVKKQQIQTENNQLDVERVSKIRNQILLLQKQEQKVINKIQKEHLKHYGLQQESIDQLDQQYFLVHIFRPEKQQFISFFQFIHYANGSLIVKDQKFCKQTQVTDCEKDQSQPLMKKEYFADYQPGFQNKLKQIEQQFAIIKMRQHKKEEQ